jgi:hypothetical protein
MPVPNPLAEALGLDIADILERLERLERLEQLGSSTIATSDDDAAPLVDVVTAAVDQASDTPDLDERLALAEEAVAVASALADQARDAGVAAGEAGEQAASDAALAADQALADAQTALDNAREAAAAADAATAAGEAATAAAADARAQAVDAAAKAVTAGQKAQAATDAAGLATTAAQTATTAAGTAQIAADAAGTKATTATQAAADANTAALSAAGIANSKGEVIAQPTRPTGSRATTANLWFDTSTDSAGKVKNTPNTYMPVTLPDPNTLAVILPAASAQTETEVMRASVVPNAKTPVSLALSASMLLNGAVKSSIARLRDGATGAVLASYVFSDKGDSGGGNAETWTLPAGFTATPTAAVLVVTIQSNNANSPTVYSLHRTITANNWVASTDQKVVDAAAAAATAQQAAQTAQQAAQTAQNTANGKNTVTYSATAPSDTVNPGTRAGDLWFVIPNTGTGIVTGQYRWSGTAWAQQTLDSAVIAALDAGKITTGLLAAARIAAKSITADKLIIGDFTNLATIDELAGLNLSATQGQTYGSDTQITGGFLTRVSNAGSFFMFTFQRGPVPFSPGDQLQFTFMAKTTDGSTVTTVQPSVWVYPLTGGALAQGTSPAVTVTGTEQTYTATVTMPTFDVRAGAQFIVGLQGVQNVPLAVRAVRVIRRTGGTLIADGSISTGKIIANAITSALIAADAITAREIAAGSVATDELAANAVTALKIAAATITGDKIVGATITGDLIAANTITAAKIAAATITGDLIAGNTITGAKLLADSISSREIGADAILARNIKAGEIVAGKLAASSVTAANIVAASITGDKLAANTVTAREILAGSITADLLSANAIDGKTITGALLQTAAAGKRVVVANNRVNFYGTDGSTDVSAGVIEGLPNGAGGGLVNVASNTGGTSFAQFGTRALPVAGSVVMYSDAAWLDSLNVRYLFNVNTGRSIDIDDTDWVYPTLAAGTNDSSDPFRVRRVGGWVTFGGLVTPTGTNQTMLNQMSVPYRPKAALGIWLDRNGSGLTQWRVRIGATGNIVLVGPSGGSGAIEFAGVPPYRAANA